MLDLVGNPEDRFSHNEAHMSVMQVASKTLSSSAFKLGIKTGKSGLFSYFPLVLFTAPEALVHPDCRNTSVVLNIPRA